MAPQPGNVRDGSTILVFGPQALAFQEDTFHHLKSVVLNDAGNRWILDVLAELPLLFKAFSKRFPKLEAISGAQLLEGLNDWFKSAKVPPASLHLPNVLLSSLVVLTQLTQYSKHLTLAHPEPGHGKDSYASHNQKTETVGFCTGMLSALAVSSAGSQAQFQRYGSVAVRLAALIGAIVDAQEVQDGVSKSFATAWNSSEKRIEMARILQQFPEVNLLCPVVAGFGLFHANSTHVAGLRFCLLR